MIVHEAPIDELGERIEWEMKVWDPTEVDLPTTVEATIVLVLLSADESANVFAESTKDEPR